MFTASICCPLDYYKFKLYRWETRMCVAHKYFGKCGVHMKGEGSGATGDARSCCQHSLLTIAFISPLVHFIVGLGLPIKFLFSPLRSKWTQCHRIWLHAKQKGEGAKQAVCSLSQWAMCLVNSCNDHMRENISNSGLVSYSLILFINS